MARLDRHGVRITYGEDLGAPRVGTRAAIAGEPLHAILRETSAAVFDPATGLATLDVAPNTLLPKPDVVEQITGVTVTSGTTTEVDKSILTRATVSWTPATSEAVRRHGRIEVQCLRAGIALTSGDWPAEFAPGDATSLTITGLGQGLHYMFRVRAISNLGVRGQWSVLKTSQNTTVPQVGTDGIAPDSVAPIATATAGGSTVYLIETTIVSASIDSKG